MTGRGCTPRPGVVRSRSSPASPRRTRSRGRRPPDGHHRTHRSRTAATRCWPHSARAGFIATADGEPDVAAEALAEPIRVLFVCTANICRSPYLELRARQLLGPDSGVEVTSAGTRGFDASRSATRWRRSSPASGRTRRRSAAGPRRRDLVDEADVVLTAEAEAPEPAAGGAAGLVPQDLHARPVRGERPRGRPRPARPRPDRRAVEPAGPGLSRPRHRRPLPARPRGGAACGGHHGGRCWRCSWTDSARSLRPMIRHSPLEQ